jgi:peptide/nickel transport system substrate-binding protein
VRRALNYAVDYETLGSSLWGDGFRRMAALQIPAFGPLYESRVRRGLNPTQLR